MPLPTHELTPLSAALAGFPDVWVQTGNFKHEVADSVCVFPYIANEWGDQQCNDSLTDIADGGGGHVRRTPIGP